MRRLNRVWIESIRRRHWLQINRHNLDIFPWLNRCVGLAMLFELFSSLLVLPASASDLLAFDQNARQNLTPTSGCGAQVNHASNSFEKIEFLIQL
ncbi:hypothetical protein KCU59_g29, partial [Aureobasidium melanogenum]